MYKKTWYVSIVFCLLILFVFNCQNFFCLFPCFGGCADFVDADGVKKVSSFKKVMRYVSAMQEEGGLCVFDIDDTIIERLTKDFTEKRVPFDIKQAQKKFPCMALTARYAWRSQETNDQLQQLGLFFYHVPYQEDLSFVADTQCVYTNGVLSNSSGDKGKALVAFFDIIGFVPKLVLFVDDYMQFVLQVRKALSERGIDGIYLLYDGS